MKITINGTTYEAERIPASMSRRAMELNATALNAAADAEALKQTKNAGGTAELMALLMTNLDEKTQLISEVFGGEISAEDVKNEMTMAEINAIINAIVSGK